ncbi:MAG: hypothetical protein V4498_07530 [candidate division FCPU426 bacterium]
MKALLLAGLSLFGGPKAHAEEPLNPDMSRRPLPQATPTHEIPVPPALKLEDLSAAESRWKGELADLSVQVRALEAKISSTAKASESAAQAATDSLAKSKDLQSAIERKAERMENLLDLMSTLKRDVNDNSHEIAEVKDSLEKLRKDQAQSGGKAAGEWWDQLATWRYMPLTAAVLGAVALGLAASHQ